MQAANLTVVNRQSDHNDETRLLLSCSDGSALNLSISVHGDLEELRSEWEAFEQNAICSPFQSFSWLKTWHDKIGRPGGEEPVVVALRDGQERLLFLLPLVRMKTPLGDMLVDMGQPVCDYHAPLYAPHFVKSVNRDAMEQIWSFILRSLPETDLVVLVKQPAYLGKTPNPMAWVCTKEYFTPTSYQMSLEGASDWPELFKEKRSGKARSRLKGKRNKLAKMGDLSFHAVTDPSARAALLDTLLAMKRADLESMGKNNIFDTPEIQNFLTAYSSQTSQNDCLVIHVLRCGGEDVAITFSLRWHGRLYYFIASYLRGEYGRTSPGVLALCDLFEWCMEQKLDTFDFTVGDESYKLDWSDQTTTLYCGTFPVTVKGRFGERLEAAKLSLKHTIKSSPAMYKFASALMFRFRK